MIGTVTGVVSGVVSGTTMITYALGTCISTKVMTINPLPSTIAGVDAVCVGFTTVLSDAATGGTWMSTNNAVGTVVPTTGVVGGVSPGTTQISYTLPTGCAMAVIVTVNIIPTATPSSSTVCVGGTVGLTGTPGGAWSSMAPGTVAVISGGLEGVSVGTTTISYTLPTGCYTDFVETATVSVTSILGATGVCVGASTTLSDATAGGTWTASAPAIATVGPATGVVAGIASGTENITYTLSTGCMATTVVTVYPAPAAISGATGICAAGVTTLNDATTGGIWSSGTPAIAAAGSVTGIVTGVATGTADITYTLATGCYSTIVVTVNAIPTITASAISNCGGTYSLNGTGAGTGGTYVWGPSTGLSCSSCATSVATIFSTSMYTVTGTDINGCINTDTITVNGNRISGYITMTVTPTDTLKVWLIHFNPLDSSLIAQDSTLSCLDGTTPYYEFDNDTAGSYMVKAKLLSSVPGTSGYVPTYGLSSSLWSAAATITHASATDTQHINMIYGTVPSGPGFIGGLISYGAGRNTASGVPAVGMLVYLKDAANNILTYTYTDVTGAYAFSGLANGSYNIYPVDYKYNTIAWLGATINSSAETFNSGDFYQHTTLHTITPYGTVCCMPIVTLQQ